MHKYLDEREREREKRVKYERESKNTDNSTKTQVVKGWGGHREETKLESWWGE